MDDRRPGHHQHLPPRSRAARSRSATRPPGAPSARTTPRRHELEHLRAPPRAPAPARLAAHHHPVAGADAVHRDGIGVAVRTTRPQSISGFSMGSQVPSTRTPRQVRRRVEAGGQHAVAVGLHERGVLLPGAVGPVHLQLVDQRPSTSSSPVTAMRALDGSRPSCRSTPRRSRSRSPPSRIVSRILASSSESTMCPVTSMVSVGMHRDIMPPAMGQPINVVEKPSSTPGVARFETNRSLTGMGHERYARRRHPRRPARRRAGPPPVRQRRRHRGPRQRQHGHGAPGRRVDGREAARRHPRAVHLLPPAADGPDPSQWSCRQRIHTE